MEMMTTKQFGKEKERCDMAIRKYCPKCNRNRLWHSAYKKRELALGEKPSDFRFFVCSKCNYACDFKTGEEIKDWRKKYYGE